uniref:Death domain-containing protein n=1 Tax=Amphimedon queenslandica TaxID=400682 RepID=A0A1X7SXX2_AMPQE
QILRQYKFPQAKWFELGLNLGLLHPTLEAIEADHRGNTSRCLMECLTKWLSKADQNVRHLTWQSLVIAIRRLNETRVSENVART